MMASAVAAGRHAIPALEGLTEIGRIVEAERGRDFLDLDAIIGQQLGRACTQKVIHDALVGGPEASQPPNQRARCEVQMGGDFVQRRQRATAVRDLEGAAEKATHLAEGGAFARGGLRCLALR